MMVLAFGMSMPLSMMVVASRMSASPLTKVRMTFSSSSFSICPWPMRILAFGTRALILSLMVWMVWTRLWRKKIWPPRSISLVMALRMMRSSYPQMEVWTGTLLGGAVSMVDMSLVPMSERYSVRGMGVAESVRRSMPAKSSLNFSLCLTPKRCSSSTMATPRFWKWMSFETSLWVPMTMSTDPSARPLMVERISAGLRKRLSSSMRIG